MNGLDAVKQAELLLPKEILAGTVSKGGQTMTVQEFLENNIAPVANGKTANDIVILVNTRLKKYITEAPKREVSFQDPYEYTSIPVSAPTIVHETLNESFTISATTPTIKFEEPTLIDEVSEPFVITTKLPTIRFEEMELIQAKQEALAAFLNSDPKYSQEHRISETETNSFKAFIDLYPMELISLENGIISIMMGPNKVTISDAYEKFMAPINMYESELLEEKFRVIVGEIYDIMEYREIDDRNKEILFKSKTSSGKTFFDYVKEDVLPTITNTYSGPNGEELHNYLDKILGMQIAFDNERVNTNNNVDPTGVTLDEVNKVGEIKILDGSITSEMLTLLTNSEKNSLNSNLVQTSDEKMYVSRFEQLEVGIKLITDRDDLEVKYDEFLNLVAEAQLKCPESAYIKTLIARINIIYENKSKSLKTIETNKDTIKMMFETALAELKYEVSLASTFEEIVNCRKTIKQVEEQMTSLGFNSNVYSAAIENIKTTLQTRTLQVQQIKEVEQNRTLAA